MGPPTLHILKMTRIDPIPTGKGVSKIPVNKKNVVLCMIVALLLCIAQITGSTLLILGCIGIYVIVVARCCIQDFTLPILLFFLPWSPIIRTGPESVSFYTLTLVMVCLISVIKKRFAFRKYQIKSGIILLFLTLLSKLLDASGLTFAYVAFLMMIVFFPVVKEEVYKNKYDFYQAAVFFALGVIIASICALSFAQYPNIGRFIRVDEYLTIIRRSGFYGDANFYTAQVLAALAGVLSLIIREEGRGRRLFLGALIFLLLYCGLLSGSKSFVIVAATVMVIWVIAILKMRGRAGLKIVLFLAMAMLGAYIATSALFGGLIQVLLTRFSGANDLESFTTGRISLWETYLTGIFSDLKMFFLGKGFTSTLIAELSSHNTLIQILYQLGVLGTMVLGYWIVCFYRRVYRVERRRRMFDLKILIVPVGCFFPWMAIDVLFFDEFFLLQWYVLLALNRQSGPVTKLETRTEVSYGRENEK